ncbi:MAG: S9 family peptidase [Gemmatimonadetes bacterium]|nr:S9 family peptidase [Gemmatimonadota bacterium]
MAARILRLAGVVAMVAPGSLAGAQTVDIASLVGAPFAHGLVGHGSTMAWVHTTRGVRNVWIATAPGFTGRQLTAFSADDGQDIGGLAIAPDGRTVFFTRGGAANRRGEVPNPTSDPAGQEQLVWRIGTGPGATAAKVGQGSGPVVSPRGDRVAFLRGGQVWVAPVAQPGEPTSLFKMRGSAGDLAWSPDGDRLLFVSNRGDHAFVGVYHLTAKRIQWIDPSFDTDQDPAWSPDGTRLAFIRIPAGITMPLFGPIREAPPWSIRVADAATGTSAEVWRAAPGRGSVVQDVTGPRLSWTASDRLVFPWERDGWQHLYAITPAGGEPKLLTPGEGEVEYLTLSADRRSVLYNANIGDIDRRDIFEADPVAGTTRALTTGRDIEWAPVALAGGALGLLRSDARTPAHAAVMIGGATRAVAPQAIPADYPAAALVEPSQVIFSSTDGIKIHGQLFLPPGLRPGERRPAVAFFHGGSRRQMLLGFHYLGYYSGTYAMNQWLAQQGYVVLSVNFRSGTGYGLEFREALNYGATGMSEYHDVMATGLYLQGRPDVDPRRIGLWGGSYGGVMTAMGLAKSSDLYAAGVDIHGVHDWNSGIQNFVPSYNPLERPEAARLAFESSPLRWVDTWRSPVLLIHGDDDRNVNFNESVRLIAALRARKVDVESLVLPDEVHDFLTFANWDRIYRATADFFHRKLR